jgi:hypothetical protein
MTPEARLVQLVVDGALRRKRGETPPDYSQEAARLIVEVGAHDTGFEKFFTHLAAELKANDLAMPSFDELPPAIAPFAAMFGSAIVIDTDGYIDMEATAAELDASAERTFGASPRKVREAALEAQIRREVRESIAESMRRHGLTPLADVKPHAAEDGDFVGGARDANDASDDDDA